MRNIYTRMKRTVILFQLGVCSVDGVRSADSPQLLLLQTKDVILPVLPFANRRFFVQNYRQKQSLVLKRIPCKVSYFCVKKYIYSTIQIPLYLIDLFNFIYTTLTPIAEIWRVQNNTTSRLIYSFCISIICRILIKLYETKMLKRIILC